MLHRIKCDSTLVRSWLDPDSLWIFPHRQGQVKCNVWGGVWTRLETRWLDWLDWIHVSGTKPTFLVYSHTQRYAIWVAIGSFPYMTYPFSLLSPLFESVHVSCCHDLWHMVLPGPLDKLSPSGESSKQGTYLGSLLSHPDMINICSPVLNSNRFIYPNWSRLKYILYTHNTRTLESVLHILSHYIYV